MDFVRVYDVHAQAREKLFDWLRPLSQEQYLQSFPSFVQQVRREDGEPGT
jgi:uncharacterized damage-inducible protein DinB